VTTLAGKINGAFGSADGLGTNASFREPFGGVVDSLGNIYVTDTYNSLIRKISPSGSVSTFAGSTLGSADLTGTNATFYLPYGITIDLSDNLYVADLGNHRIRKITPLGVVTTFAGGGGGGQGAGQGYTDGTGTNALFNQPSGITIDLSGNLYVVELGDRVRKITPLGIVSTIAGGTSAGSTNGTGTNASFNNPYGIAVDSLGNLYVADTGNNRIRKITPDGIVSTLAGNGTSGYIDGIGTSSLFNFPSGVAVDRNDNIFVTDTSNHRIRKITPGKVVSTLAGNGTAGFTEGTASNALFNMPFGIAVDTIGNVYIGDYNNHRIRKITPGGVVNTLAGSGSAAFADGVGLTSSFNRPLGLALDLNGHLYVADTNNNCIRKITMYTQANGVDSAILNLIKGGSIVAIDEPYQREGPIFVSSRDKLLLT
jgi:sugar lactone lactonase YvrE